MTNSKAVAPKKQRKVIGRSLNKLELDTTPVVTQEKIFTLRSGKKATFKLVHLSHAELTEDTFVTTEINGREQDALTLEGVAGIRRTLKQNQFIPCIGRKNNNKTEFLDGSRRRFCAINDNHGLDILVTENELSMDDAKGLAADIQTASEHNIREFGLPLLKLEQEGLSHRKIAQLTGNSLSKVTRSIQAAKVPSNMLSPFPVRNELNQPDYKLLLTISNEFDHQGIELETLVDLVKADMSQLDKSVPNDEFKSQILLLYRRHADNYLDKPDTKKVETTETTNFHEFYDTSMHAKKNVKGRNITYSFAKLSQAAQRDIEHAIKEQLEKHYAK